MKPPPAMAIASTSSLLSSPFFSGGVAGESRRSSAISFASNFPSLAISVNSVAAPPLHVPRKVIPMFSFFGFSYFDF